MKTTAKNILLFMITVVFVFSLCACSVMETVTDNGYYVKVNNEELTKEYIGYFFSVAQESMLSEAGYTPDNSTQNDIDTYWATTELEGKNAVKAARDVAVNNAVMQKVVFQKAKEEGITLSEDEIAYLESDLESVVSANGGEEAFGELLALKGTDAASYKQILSENMYMEKLFEKYDSEGLLEVTDDELAAFSSLNSEKYPADNMVYELKKHKFNELSLDWEKDADIIIDDEKINEFDV